MAALEHTSTITSVQDTYETDSDSDESVPPPPPETRAEKLERLSKEYEEEMARTGGQGCTNCSA
jgi:hypothetical protein